MKSQRRRFLHLTAGAVALPALSRIARAQAYPTRSVTMLVPAATGGPLDTIGRIVAERMRVSLGQPIIIENVAGAAGSIGVGRAARAAGDGYTLSLGNLSTHVFNGALYAQASNVLNEFEPISLMTHGSHLLVAKKSMAAKDLKELIAWLKANPDKATGGTAGVGSAQHVFAVFFQNATGTRFPFAHYRGAAPAMQDLVAGQIDIMDSDLVTALPQVRAGTIKVYAAMAKKRAAAAPEIPTVDEAGLPGFYNSVWTALWAPKGTPKDVVAKLNAATVYALADPALRQQVADNGGEVFPREQLTPEGLGVYQKAEIEKWWPIIKAANIKGE